MSIFMSIKDIKIFKSKLVFLAVFMFAISLVLYGCAKKPAPSSKVLAIVNGKPITISEFESEIVKLPPNLKAYISTPQGEKKFLKNLVERQLLADQAIKDGLNKSKTYKTQLSDFKQSLLVQILLNKKIQKKTAVTEKEAKAYYKKHYNLFNLPAKINISYIQTASSKAAEAVLSSLQKKVSFSKLAEKYSTAPNAKTGGGLGWIKFGQTQPAFNQAAFGIQKVGGYSNIIRVGKNFDIIKLNKIQQGKPKPFSKLKGELLTILKEKKGEKLFKDYMAKLKKSAKIKMFYNNLPVSKPGLAPKPKSAKNAK